MKIFFDTEFTGLHKNTTLISIGCVDEDGRSFYAELSDYDKSQCDAWINENVISHLEYPEGVHGIFRVNRYGQTGAFGNTSFVREKLTAWLAKYDEVQMVSDVCHYDMVLFISIFGTAFDLPNGVNAACHDINQDIAQFMHISESEAFDASREGILANNEITIQGDKHNALYDAKVIRALYDIVCEE